MRWIQKRPAIDPVPTKVKGQTPSQSAQVGFPDRIGSLTGGHRHLAAITCMM
jgi:hypothetical protein